MPVNITGDFGGSDTRTAQQKYVDAIKANMANLPQTQAMLQNASPTIQQQFGIAPSTPKVTAQNTVASNTPAIGTQTEQTPTQLVTAPTQSPIQVQQTPQFDMAAEIQKLRNANIQRQIGILGTARDKTLSSLNQEKSTIKPMYYDKGNQVRATSANQARSFSEYLAQRGLSSAGVSAEGVLKNQGALQSNLGSLGRQEQSAYDDIARRTSDAETAYQQGVAGANADADIFASQQTLSELGKQRDYAREDTRNAVLDNRYTSETAYNQSRDTVADNRYNTEYKDSRGDVQYNKDYQTNRDTVADNRYKQEYSDKTAQQDFENTLNQSQFNESVAQNKFTRDLQTKGFTAEQAQRKWDNAYKTKAFEQSIKDGKLAQSNWQTEMTFKQAQSRIENALSQGRLSQDGAQLALSQAKFNADQDPKSLDNLYKKAQIENIQNKGVNYDYKTDPDYADDYQYAINSKNGEEILTEKAADFIKKYGIEGYNTLINAARGE